MEMKMCDGLGKHGPPSTWCNRHYLLYQILVYDTLILYFLSFSLLPVAQPQSHSILKFGKSKQKRRKMHLKIPLIFTETATATQWLNLHLTYNKQTHKYEHVKKYIFIPAYIHSLQVFSRSGISPFTIPRSLYGGGD